MAAMEWDEPGMKRNKNVRFRMGQGSNTVSYYPPQSALEVGRNPSGYNPNQLPAIRQSGLPTVTSRGALPSVVPPQTGFQMGTGSPVEISSIARPVTPHLQIGYDGPKERISLGQVRQNLNRGKFVGPPSPEGYTGTQTQAQSPSEGFVGPKNTGAFAPRTTFGGSQVIDPSGSLAGELYRRLSKSTGRYIPGLEQMWGGQPNADEWRQDADDAYQQARSGFKINPMTTSRAAGIPALPTQQPSPVLSKFSNGMDATPENARRAIELGLPGAVAANEVLNPETPTYGETPGSAYIYGGRDFMAKGSGPATGGFSRPKDADKYVQEEQNRVNQFWADVAKQKAMETADKQNSIMTQLDSAIRSGNQEQATMLTNALKGVGAIQPLDMSKQGALDIERSQVPYRNKLNEAQAKHYAGLNETTVGGQRLKALADILEAKLKGNKTGALTPDQRIKLEEMKLTNPEGYAALAKEYGITG